MSDELQFVVDRLRSLEEFAGQESNHEKLKFVGHLNRRDAENAKEAQRSISRIHPFMRPFVSAVIVM